MHSLLRRRFPKFHRLTGLNPRSSVSRDARERLEPTGILNKYVCEELAGEYAKYWTKVKEDNGEGLEEIQRNALNRWHAFWLGFGGKIEQPSLPVDFFIELKRLPIQLWTRELIQDFLNTLLHEMSDAFLMIYSTPLGVPGSWRFRRIVETEGLTGHGPCWVKVAEALEAEADSSLGGSWDNRDLNITRSCYLEEEALKGHWI